MSKSKIIGIPLQVIIGKLVPLVEIEVRGVYFSKNFEQIYQSKRSEWNWQIEKTKFGDDKHIVDIEFADQVIEILLKDM